MLNSMGDSGEPCGMPTWTGVKVDSVAALSESFTALLDRYDITQFVI